jgi:hypothetical protein
MRTQWKILIAVGLGIFVAYLCTICQASTRPTSQMLTNEFTFYNNKYFGAMPEVVTIQYGNLTEDDSMGKTYKMDNGSYLIVIDQKTNPILKTADGTLIHEMCHIKLNSIRDLTFTSKELEDHGPSFQACMLDKASQGAFKDIW